MSKNRRDGSKLSFSERDKARRDGNGRRERTDGPRGRGASHAQKSYRAALERAFESGRVAEFAETLTRTVDPRPVARSAPPSPAAADAKPATAPAPLPPPPPPDPAIIERRKLLAHLKKVEGRDEISRAVDKLLERFDLPDDYELLEKALIHKDTGVVLRVIECIERKLVKGKPRRTRSLSAQLRLLEDTHDDVDVRSRAASVRSAL